MGFNPIKWLIGLFTKKPEPCVTPKNPKRYRALAINGKPVTPQLDTRYYVPIPTIPAVIPSGADIAGRLETPELKERIAKGDAVEVQPAEGWDSIPIEFYGDELGKKLINGEEIHDKTVRQRL